MEGDTAEDDSSMAPVIDALQQVLCGRMESGRLNRLVLGAQLEWPEVDLLRAYLGYAHQLGIAPQIRAAASTLLRYPEATRSLVTLFRVRFDPELEGDREMAQCTALRSVTRARETIQRADDDRVFGLLLDLILATVRTAFFAPADDGDHCIVLKLHPEKLAHAPSPRPYAEIYVHSAEMCGVHLRGGPVARGGIRWSDRVQDFRREILGLMKTQRVKNGLIVPVGAKGGFVLRSFEGRDPPRAAVDWQYARFIRALLSLTDNVIDGGTYRPANVVAHDGDDPYLVVAADRGTAHLSDVANEVAGECGYWLGDAFASGGSDGYDHKAFGITARGAWVCARRHFLELGIDPEQEIFTVAGVGDMSGDVFGNGLLLTRRAKLLAAFDGRHVFLDPDPDPERSWAERQRLFELSSSSWADYDEAVISTGGAVFDRSARRVELSPEARAVLGVAATAISGEDLVRAVLRMPVDLFWMGGVGTYVKASAEPHGDVGDRANDSVRVDASELRARVVAEGANLGLSQRARVEFSLRGGRVYTDAIDNSGGVDLSDREVNFKIAMAAGDLPRSERNRLLRDCAEEACRAVLANSASQSRCVSLDWRRAAEDPDRMALAAEFLVAADSLDAELEFLPDREGLRARVKATGRGYTPPELAILLGYTKRLAKRELAASELLKHPSFEPVLSGYFPEGLRERLSDAIAAHPLRREIAAATLTNRVIDQAGVTLIPELCSALGVGVAQVIAAYHTIDRLLDVDHLRFRFETEHVPETARLVAALRVEESVRGAVRCCLGLAHDWLEPEAFAQQTALVRDLRELLDGQLSQEERREVECRAQQLVELGFDAELATEIESLPLLVRELGVLSLAPASDAPLPRVLELHARIGREARIVWTLERLGHLDRRDGWERVAAESLYVELLETQRQLAGRLLGEGVGTDALESFLEDSAPALRHIHDTARRMEAEESPSLASLAVLAGQIRRLLP
jgi:glutamate dehydrogenase